MEYCPNCVTRLVKQHRLLGGLNVWLVCPECGFRKRPMSAWMKWNDKRIEDETNNHNKKEEEE